MNNGRDARDVADAIVRLANAPAGTRPLRTTVPAFPPADALNDAWARVQIPMLEELGFAQLLPKARSTQAKERFPRR